MRAQRAGLPVQLAFVDVLLPTVEDVLDALGGRTVLVPALLSTGFHVANDIPRMARRRRGGAAVARHLGPDRLLSEALAAQLPVAALPAAGVALVSAGSSDPAARADLDAAAVDLADLLGVPVRGASLSDPDLDLAGVAVARYLLAEGRMADSIAARAASAGAAFVTEPIGAHPAVASLVLQRYDEGLPS